MYVFDKFHFQGTHHYGFPKTGSFRVKFMLESVEDLRQTLKKRGSDLMVACGNPEEEISKILKSLGTESLTLICQAEVTKEETDVENKLIKVCQEHRSSFLKIWGSTLYHKADLPFPIRNVPDNYTAFRKEVEAKIKVRAEILMPEKMKPLPKLNGLSLGDVPTYDQLNATEPKAHPGSAFPFKGGETAALHRLHSYLWETNAVAQYKVTRNGLLGTEYSTKFSPWLALGCISPRRIFWEIQKYEKERTKNDSTYWVIFEMIWRDYFKFVCSRYGNRVFYPYGLKGQPKTWKKDMKLFELWKSKY